jgi:hypothetical protein
MKWKFTTLTLMIAFFSVSANSATTHINYDMSGGAVFLTASGTASVTVYGSIGGVLFTRVVTGTASGATSWNIAGSLDVVVDDIGTITTTSDLSAQRRAGAIDINLPLFNLGGLVDVNLDASLKSTDSTMNLTDESGALVNSTDWLIDQIYELNPGLIFSTSATGRLISINSVPLPQTLKLSNQASQSSAVLNTPSGVTSGSFLSGYYNSGCQVEGLFTCLATIESVHYDLSGVYLTSTSLNATDFSSTLLPTVVPVPTAIWLFGSGLLGLVGMARRKKA